MADKLVLAEADPRRLVPPSAAGQAFETTGAAT